jgi:DNA-binding PucR family transcriptional regulator
MTGKYDVGYGKPPTAGQFKKGKSGNPKGRRKGARNLKTDLLEELHDRIPISERGRRKTFTKQQVLLKRLMNEGISGNFKASALLLQLSMQFERAGDFVPATTPLSSEDEEILQRYAASVQAKSKP